MHRLNTKSILFIICLLLSFTLFSSCKKKEAEKRVTLVYAYRGDETDIKLNEEVIRNFEGKYLDIKIKKIHIAGNYLAKLQTMISGGTPPDVMMDGWAMSAAQLPPEAIGNTFLELIQFIEKDEGFQKTLKDIYPQLIEWHKYRGKLFALPRCQNPLSLFYNKKLFDEENLTYPNETWTWDTFLSTCKKLARDKNNDGRIDQYGVIATAGYFYHVLIWQNGGEIFNRDKDICLLDKQEAIEAIQWQADLISKYKISPLISEIREQGEYGMFMSGRIAMYPAGYYVSAVFKDIKNFEWDVAPLPKGKNRVNIDNMGNYVIYAKTRHPEEAWKFVKYLVSAEAQNLFATSIHDVPILKSVATSSIFLNPDNPPKNKEVFLDAIDYSRNVYDAWPPSGIAPVLSRFNNELDYVWNGEKKAKDVCEKYVPIINKALEEIK